MIAYNIVNYLIGSSCAETSTRSLHTRSLKNILHNEKYSFIDSAHAINFNFSDSGLFGLCLTGAASKGNEVLQVLIEQLNALRNINADELARAKAALKTHILTAMERQSDRIEESVRNVKTFGSVKCHDYDKVIDAVSLSQVQNAVSRVLTSHPTFIAEGSDVSKLQSLEKIISALKGWLLWG